MNQAYPLAKRKSFWIALVVVTLCVLATICCGVIISSEYPPETRAPGVFPDTDIVYASNGGLGFVNADGSNPTRVEFSVKMTGGRFSGYSGQAMRPVITGDNEVVIVQSNPYGYFGMKGLYELAIWRAGEFPSICWGWGRQALVWLSADQEHIFIQTEHGIAQYPLDGCDSDDPPVNFLEANFGVPSPDLQYVAYTKFEQSGDPFVTLINLSTEEERTIGQGDYPAWSRDGEWLAYTGVDGIYTINVAGADEPQLVLSYPNPVGNTRPTYQDINDIVPPEPRWSPDGQWLLYHKQIGSETASSPDQYGVFKLNIATREEIKIAERGVYPYWRWPAEGQ